MRGSVGGQHGTRNGGSARCCGRKRAYRRRSFARGGVCGRSRFCRRRKRGSRNGRIDNARCGNAIARWRDGADFGGAGNSRNARRSSERDGALAGRSRAGVAFEWVFGRERDRIPKQYARGDGDPSVARRGKPVAGEDRSFTCRIVRAVRMIDF